MLGCGSDDDSDPTTTGTDDETDTTDTGEPPGPPPTTFGGDRPADLVVPESYDGEAELPLVIALHGYFNIPRYWAGNPVFTDFAENNDVLFIAPTGTEDEEGNFFWNGTDACCDDGSDVDDSTYLLNLIDEISAAYAVDQDAVFLIGHSNGGFMAYRMACEHADRIAGIVSVAGATYNTPADCTPSEPVNLLQIHAYDDQVIAYEGGTLDGGPHPGAVESAEIWADYNGCGDAGEQQEAVLNLIGPEAAEDTDVTPWADCPASGDVELWSINMSSHLPLFTSGAGDEIANWLSSHTK